MESKDLEDKFVLPGDKLAMKSDIKAGDGTFIKEDTIHAAVPGHVRVREGKVHVHFPKEKGTVPPRKGEIVIGRVSSVRRVHASIHLLYLIRDEELFPLENGVGASIYIGDLGPYVDEATDAIRRSDIVLGKVSIDRRSPLSLSFEGREELGCVAAHCEECGNPLTKKGKKLFCKECKEYRDRKVSSLYDFNAFSSAASLVEEGEGE